MTKKYISGLILLLLLITYGCKDEDNSIQDDERLPDKSEVHYNISALNIYELTQNLKVNYLSDDFDQLSSISLNISEDSKGYLWISSYDGLFKYDGKILKSYSDSLFDLDGTRWLRDCFRDDNNTLWIGTNNLGLVSLNTETNKTKYYSLGTNSQNLGMFIVINTLHMDKNGYLWIGTNRGVFRLNTNSDNTDVIQRFTSFYNIGTSSVLNVNQIEESSDGAIWFATDAGLLVYDQYLERIRRVHSYKDKIDIATIEVDQSDRVWVSAGSKIFYIEPETEKRKIVHSELLNFVDISAIESDNFGNIWLGSRDKGLYIIDPTDMNIVSVDIIDQEAIIDDITVDSKQNIWLITRNLGIIELSNFNGNFINYNLPQNTTIIDVISTADQITAITNKGLAIFNRNSGEWKEILVPENNPFFFYEDEDFFSIIDTNSKILIGSNHGIIEYRKHDNSFIRFKHMNNSKISNIIELKNGDVIISDEDSGIFKLDINSGNLELVQYFYNQSINCIGEDPFGNILVGTDNGLFRLNNFSRQELFVGKVTTTFTDNQEIWIGTEFAGLYKIDRYSRLKDYRFIVEGLNKKISSIERDLDGILWITTEDSIINLDPVLDRGITYYSEDGIFNNDFSRRSSFAANSGSEIFFGGVNTLISFYPSHIYDYPSSSEIVMNSFTYGNRDIDISIDPEYLSTIKLKWPYNSINFNFGLLNHYRYDSVDYTYKLEGYETKWNTYGTNGRYNSLPEGKYTLKLIARNRTNDRIIDEKEIKIIYTVPFWFYWQFQLGMALLLLALILFIYLKSVRKIGRRNKILDREVLTKTVEIEKRREATGLLRDTLMVINSNGSLFESLYFICDKSSDLLSADRSIVFLENQSGDKEIAAYWPNDFSFCLNDYKNEIEKLSNGESIVEEKMLASPVRISEEVSGGLIYLFNNKKSNRESELDICKIFSDQTSIAIANERLRELAEQSGAERERNRLARDLHDAVSQTLFSATLIADVLPKIWQKDRPLAEKKLNEMKDLTRGALAEMRTLLLELRPQIFKDADLSELLMQLVQSLAARSKVKVDIEVSGESILKVNEKIVFFRVCQESLNNTIKHSSSKNVKIKLHFDENSAILHVADDGEGFKISKTNSKSLGLKIMQERADSIGADLKIISAHEAGTEVKLSLERGK